MDGRRYARPPSPPLYNHGRSSLPMLGYSGYNDLHGLPGRRDVIADPRSSDERLSIQSPVVTTSYTMEPDSQIGRSSSLRDSNRRPYDSASAPRPHVVNSQHRRPAIHGGADRPQSPTSNPYRSSDETGEYFTIPASSGKYRGHTRGAYSATMDNAEMNRVARETGVGGVQTGTGGALYQRSRPAYSMSVGQPYDAVMDGYGDDGYGYTTPGDLAQYDLDRAAKYSSRRRESFGGSRSSRPSSMSGYPDPRSFDARERGPPPSTRGFDRLPQRSAVYDPQRTPASAVEPTMRSPRGEYFYETEPLRKHGARRPVSIYHDPGLPRRYHEDYEVTKNDDVRDGRTKKYHSKHYDEDVERRGFGIRSEHPEENGYDRKKEYERRHDHNYNYEDRVNQKLGRDKVTGTKNDVEKGKEFEDYEERSERKRDRIAGLSIAASALGAMGHESREHEPNRDTPRRRRDDEEPRKRDDVQDNGAYLDSTRKDVKERHNTEDNKVAAEGERDKALQSIGEASDVVELSGRNPRERRPSRDQRDDIREAQGRSQKADRLDDDGTLEARKSLVISDEIKGQRARKDRGPRDGSMAPFDPKDTMDLRAVRDALTQFESNKEPQREGSYDRPTPLEDRGRHEDSGEEHRGPTPRLVSPPREETKKTEKPVKGILRQPRDKFPEDPMLVREGVAPLKDAKKDGIPHDARWTKINRRLVNPEALDLGKERYEVREDFVIVLRVLNREEVQTYAEATAKLRAARDEREAREEERRRRRDRSQRYERNRPYRDVYDYDYDNRHHQKERHPLSAIDGENPKVRRITYDESASATPGAERERDRAHDRDQDGDRDERDRETGYDNRRHQKERHSLSAMDGENPKVRRITYDESALARPGAERERDRAHDTDQDRDRDERDREPAREPVRKPVRESIREPVREPAREIVRGQPVGLREDPQNPGTYLGYVRNPPMRRER